MTLPEWQQGEGARLILLEPPAAFINSNHRDHHQTRAKLTKKWRTAAMEAVLAADDVPCADRVHITIHYRFPDNRRREVGNLQPTSKALVDGIVDSGICVPDDRDENVTGPDNRRWWPNGTPLVAIEIRAVA